MLLNIIRAVIVAGIIVTVAEISGRFPRLGALLLTLPIVSILAFVMTWTNARDLPAITRLARETLVLVPLGLPFFLPLAFADKLGIGFWSAFTAGIVLASLTIALWFSFGPERL
ncbi:MAG: hypothetical protein AB7I48_10350 [Planctomycetaceae bacterium]